MTRRQHPYALALEAEGCRIYRDGEIAERKRVCEILESEHAIGREGTAVHLAIHSDLPARTAITILSVAPRAASPAFNVRPARFPTLHVVFESGSTNDQN